MRDPIVRRMIGFSILLPLLLALLACRFSIAQATSADGPAVPTPGTEAPVPAPDQPMEQPAVLTTDVPTSAPHELGLPASTIAVIVDNSDAGFRIEAGEWGTCLNGDCGGTCYDDDFRYADPECTSCLAQFIVTAAESGDHDIWAWWPRGTDRATDTPFTVFTLVSSNQPLVVDVDQRNNGDDWFRLASLPLQKNEPLFVQVGGRASGYVNADAIAITLQGSSPPEPVPAVQAESAVSWDGAPSEPSPVIHYFYSEVVPERDSCHYVHWDVGNAETVRINDVQVETAGSTEVCPQGPIEYVLFAENASGEAEQAIAIGAQVTDASRRPAEQVVVPETSVSQGETTTVIFLHHSCGANLIEQGAVRQRLTALGYEFLDHGYNGDGLVLADGTWSGHNFDVPDDNTNPDGFAAIFAQPLHDPPDNTFSHLMQYDVIAFKSCFPVSLIESDAQLAEYRNHYLAIRDRIDLYPDRLFVIVTQPPEIPNDTDPGSAARARSFTDWLASDEFLAGHANVHTFNFFDLLADTDTHMLRPEYRTAADDAHPNESANRAIGPLFADFIDQAIKKYSPSG